MMPAGMWGLHVSFGDYRSEPAADFTCRCGFRDAAAGAAAVSRFVEEIVRVHRSVCRLNRERDSGVVR